MRWQEYSALFSAQQHRLCQDSVYLSRHTLMRCLVVLLVSLSVGHAPSVLFARAQLSVCHTWGIASVLPTGVCELARCPQALVVRHVERCPTKSHSSPLLEHLSYYVAVPAPARRPKVQNGQYHALVLMAGLFEASGYSRYTAETWWQASIIYIRCGPSAGLLLSFVVR